MTELDDHELLAEFARNESEAAFAALIARYVNLVYSAALRFTGNPHHAEEITQAVFIILARKAGSLRRGTVLSGWLYQTARLTAANFVKGEIRRQRREQEAYMQSTLSEPETAAWEQIAPLLDEAMGRLGETDRNAVVLRFFENKTSQEVAATLKLNEAAAHKRVNRAVEKLRKFFTKRGVTFSAVAIAGAVSANSVQAAPLGLAMAVTAAAAKGVAVSSSTLTLIKGALKIMAWTKAKTTIVGIGILLVAGTGSVVLKNNFFPSEPSYQGRRLSEWLVDIDYGQPQEKRDKASEAVRKMGVRTLPFLLANLSVEKPNDNRYSQATWAFDALGPIAKSAIPKLTKLLKQNPGYAPIALAGIGPDAMPQLLNALTNEDFFVRDNTAAGLANAISWGKITPEQARAAFLIAIENLQYENTNILFRDNTRWRAAGLLGALKLEPDISVPVLIRAMDDTNYSVAAQCALALGSFEDRAKPAIPILTKASGSTNNLLNWAATRSLGLIQKKR
jgi:RNA polymerase sigma factor (sigma-70 family)